MARVAGIDPDLERCADFIITEPRDSHQCGGATPNATAALAKRHVVRCISGRYLALYSCMFFAQKTLNLRRVRHRIAGCRATVTKDEHDERSPRRPD
jgi:hypothetical protein